MEAHTRIHIGKIIHEPVVFGNFEPLPSYGIPLFVSLDEFYPRLSKGVATATQSVDVTKHGNMEIAVECRKEGYLCNGVFREKQ